MTYLFLLADGLDREGEIAASMAEQRNMFRRFLEQVSPSGAMPEYGDSGDAQWGMFHAWGAWVAALERVGATAQSGEYRWAAAQMFEAACRHGGAAAEPLDAMTSAYALCLAAQWRDRRIEPRPVAAKSGIAHRREPGNDLAADKLILAPSRRPGAPFVMAELYARGFHAHEDQLGADSVFRASRHAAVARAGLSQPGVGASQLAPDAAARRTVSARAPAGRAGCSREASLPAKRLPPLDAPGDRSLRRFDKLIFRIAEDQPVDLCVENLRLSGPKGELKLDDFAALGRWHGSRQELVPGSSSGRQARGSAFAAGPASCRATG